MNDNFPDSLKNVLPKVKLNAPPPAPRIGDFEDPLRDVDSDSFAPNRTANNTEELVEIMKRMEQSAKEESDKNRTRFIITSFIAGAAAIAAILGLIDLF